MKIVCVGGGAASFFFAAELSRQAPGTDIVILEQGRNFLNKVLISGGGRCNVTHHCLDPARLVDFYPRGGHKLLGAFERFGPKQTINWFARKGVKLKTEEDGRMFPVTDKSSTIAECLKTACTIGGVQLRNRSKVTSIAQDSNQGHAWEVEVNGSEKVCADYMFIAPGSSKMMWESLANLGHNIVPPVPSLFTFLIRDPRLDHLAGVSVDQVKLTIDGDEISASGPLLITHRGLSGPAVLKMSAWGARVFHQMNYKFTLKVDFRPDLSAEDIRSWRDLHGKKLLGNKHLLELPRRLAGTLLAHAGLDPDKKIASISRGEMDALVNMLKASEFHVQGQNRFKDEFVTAGGVDLSEVDLDRFSSKILPNVYMAGEVLNIDAVTGGFNFQAAWTGAWIAANTLLASNAVT